MHGSPSKVDKDRCLSTENVFSTPKGLLYTEIAANSDEEEIYDSNDELELEMHINEELSNILSIDNSKNINQINKVDIVNLTA
jgi:hypothetical protein